MVENLILDRKFAAQDMRFAMLCASSKAFWFPSTSFDILVNSDMVYAYPFMLTDVAPVSVIKAYTRLRTRFL
jgi:hypothetical protein